jgi:hypothetical protein
MGSNTAKLGQLRPVTFHLKTDPKGALQYGLIAEEVAQVYPELVVRNESGRIDSVRYDELAPMLLKEVQEQQRKIAAQTEHIRAFGALQEELASQSARIVAQDEHIAAQAAEIRNLRQQQKQFATQAEIKNLQQELHAALLGLQANNDSSARR